MWEGTGSHPTSSQKADGWVEAEVESSESISWKKWKIKLRKRVVCSKSLTSSWQKPTGNSNSRIRTRSYLFIPSVLATCKA